MEKKDIDQINLEWYKLKKLIDKYPRQFGLIYTEREGYLLYINVD